MKPVEFRVAPRLHPLPSLLSRGRDSFNREQVQSVRLCPLPRVLGLGDRYNDLEVHLVKVKVKAVALHSLLPENVLFWRSPLGGSLSLGVE